MKTHTRIPKDYEVQPLKPGEQAQDRATCGHCGLSWDDGKITSMTPTPAGRCPFEYFHVYPMPKKTARRAAPDLRPLVRQLFSHVDAKGHPQTRPGGTGEYDVLVPIPASLLRELRAALDSETT